MALLTRSHHLFGCLTGTAADGRMNLCLHVLACIPIVADTQTTKELSDYLNLA